MLGGGIHLGLNPSNNPDGQNLGIHIFVYVYKAHMCMYMLGGGIDLGLTPFAFDIFFLPEKNGKRCKRKPTIISNLKYYNI